MRLLHLLALMLATTPAIAADVPVYTMAQSSLPPKWISRDSGVEGVCPDILNAMQRAEPELRFSGQESFGTLPMIEKALESGRISAACALLDTPERRRIARRSQLPLYMVRHRVAVAATDAVNVATLADLVRLKPRVATSRGAGYADMLRAMGLDVDDSTSDNLVNLKKIVAGHDRFFYMNDLTTAWLLREHSMHSQIRMLPATLKEEPIYFWISRKASAQQTVLLESALHKLSANGELARIYERWSADH